MPMTASGVRPAFTCSPETADNTATTAAAAAAAAAATAAADVYG